MKTLIAAIIIGLFLFAVGCITKPPQPDPTPVVHTFGDGSRYGDIKYGE